MSTIVDYKTLTNLNNISRSSPYKFNLDNHRLSLVRRIKNYFKWKIIKVLKLRTIDGKEVKPYYRVFFKPTPMNPETDAGSLIESLDVEQLAAIVGLQTFSIAVDKVDFVEIFGSSFGKEISDE